MRAARDDAHACDERGIHVCKRPPFRERDHGHDSRMCPREPHTDLDQRRRVCTQLARTAPRKQPHDPRVGRDREFRSERRFVEFRLEIVEQRVSDERGRDASGLEDRLLEREHDREPVDPGRHRGSAFGVPCPDLRRDVIEHARTALPELRAEAKVEARVIHEQHGIGPKALQLTQDGVSRPEQHRQLR